MNNSVRRVHRKVLFYHCTTLSFAYHFPVEADPFTQPPTSAPSITAPRCDALAIGRCSHRTWGINRTPLCKPPSGRLVVILQSGQAFFSPSEEASVCFD